MNIKKLPKDLKEAIFSEESFDVLRFIWAELNLSEKQKQELGSESGLYLSGMTKSDRFVPNLMYRMDINRTSAEAIKEKIDVEIVSKIKASFEYAQNHDLTSEDAAATETAVEQTPAIKEDDGGVDMIEEMTANQSLDETNLSKDSIMKGIENPLNKVEKVSEDDKYTNYVPLNIVKDDVMKGIEDPKEKPEQEPDDSEATDLDVELDTILKKPRQNLNVNLPTDIEENIPKFSDVHVEPKAVIPNTKPAPIQNITARQTPVTKYTGTDPYREPIE